MNQKASLSVGDVAKRCGVAVSAIHFYEKKGLISSIRNAGNQRRFSRDVLRRVSIIKAAQKVGISLANIQKAFENLPNQRTITKTEWQVLANQWELELESKINYLENLKKYLTGCIGCGCLSMDNCPLYNPDDKLGHLGPGAHLLEK